MSPTFLSTDHLCIYPLSLMYLYYLSVCLSICWFSCRTLFNTCLSKNHTLYAQTDSSFHWHPHPSVHGMILYASYMWPSLLTITTKLADFQGWCLLWSYCIEEEAGWVRWAMMAGHTTVMEQEQEHRPVLVPYVFNLSWVKPGVTGMTCICWLVSYLST